MNEKSVSRPLSRRTFLTGVGATVGMAVLAACAAPAAAPAAPAAAPASSGNSSASSGSAAKTTVRAHMVKKQDVSDWIQTGLDKDIDGFVSKNPDIELSLETIPGWTDAYIPKILSFAAAGTLGDLVWYPPRHRSHIAWGTSYNIVTDLRPIAEGAGYDIDANFFKGAVEVNSNGGKTYWMSYISAQT
jgi:ABC-type glycerol-3-phosphate transport system substrate-binding protein